MDFIEQWFGISPDGGDGSLEVLWIVGIVVVITAIDIPSPHHRLAVVAACARALKRHAPDGAIIEPHTVVASSPAV